MGKLFKLLLTTLLVVAILIGMVFIYLLTIFDPNDYKTEIQTLVKTQTQLDLSIDGDLSLSVFPWLGISANNVSLGTPSEQLAAVKTAQVYAKLEPLLQGELIVDGVKFENLELNLAVDKNGKGNWELEREDEQSKTQTDTKPTPGTASVAALYVGNINIENASINYRNQQNNTQHQLSNLTLRISNASLQDTFPLSADFNYLSPPEGQSLPAHLTTKITLNLDRDTVRLDDLVLDLADTRIVGNIEGTQISASPTITTKLQISDLNPGKWANLLNNPALADFNLPLNLSTNATLDLEQDALQLESFELSSTNLNAKGNIKVTQLSTKPGAQGNLQIASDDLRSLMSQLGLPSIETRDSRALSAISAKFDVTGTPQSIALSKLNLVLDNTKIQGAVNIKNFEKPAIQFNLNGDNLNLDSYIATDSAGQPGTSPQNVQKRNANQALLLPIALMREINMNGRLRFKQLIASGLMLENLDLKTNATNGLISLRQVKGNIYGGAFDASGSIDARGNTPQFKFSKQLTGMQAGPVLKELAQVDLVSGKLDLNINASATGNSIDRIKSTLNGKLNFAVSDGLLKEINLEQMVCQGIARIRQTQLASSEQQYTQFNTLNGNMVITNGVVNTQGINIAIDNLKALATGDISLPNETINYRIKTTIIGDLENQACEVHERYRNVAWPVRCKGRWDTDPSKLCQLDRKEMQRIIGRLAEKEIKRKAGEKLQEKLREKFGDEFGDQLKKIFDF